MDLIDKGTHLEDAQGNKFAKSMSGKEKKRRKRPRRISPSDSDILFGLYIEKAKGNLTLTQICKATGFASSTVCQHAKDKGFAEKIERILKTSKANAGLSVEKVQSNLAGRLIQGAEDHQLSIDDLMAKTRKHFGKMKGPTILKNAKEIDTLDKVGRRLYKLDTEEERAATAPVLNVAFLMGVGITVSTATPDADRRPD